MLQRFAFDLDPIYRIIPIHEADRYGDNNKSWCWYTGISSDDIREGHSHVLNAGAQIEFRRHQTDILA